MADSGGEPLWKKRKKNIHKNRTKSWCKKKIRWFESVLKVCHVTVVNEQLLPPTKTCFQLVKRNHRKKKVETTTSAVIFKKMQAVLTRSQIFS